ncbi:MAG TPA: zf-HC2 domain-containing protein [Pyrinomonadaceae bacterium]|jgi:hypothetical protein
MRASGHITAETVESYRRRLLPAAALLAVQAHAAACAECRARLAGAVGLNEAFAKMHAEFSGRDALDDEPAHLSHEQLAAFVDGSLDEVSSELTESHLAVCAECAGDANDLRQYQSIAAAAPTAATPIIGSPAKAAGTWRRRLSSFDFMPSLRVLVPAAAAATVVIVALLGLWLASRRSTTPDAGAGARMNPVGRNDNVPSNTITPGLNPAVSSTAAPTPEQPARDSKGHGELAATSQPSRPSRSTPNTNAGTAAPAARAPYLALNDGGGRVVFAGRADLRGLEALSPAARRAVRRSLATRRAETPRVLDGLARGAGGVLMSNAPTADAQGGVPFALVGPVGRVVRADRPVLRWRPLAGAVSYRVAIVNSNFQVVAESAPTPATEWTPPAPLVRGQTYYWQVTATLADGGEIISPRSPASQARFRILEQDTADELRRVETAAPDSHLARGVLYARAGLLEEAEAEFLKLVSLNPRSPVARQLLRSVRRR